MEDIIGENDKNDTSFECLCEGCIASFIQAQCYGSIGVKRKYTVLPRINIRLKPLREAQNSWLHPLTRPIPKYGDKYTMHPISEGTTLIFQGSKPINQ
jgi:hypothetical protein